MQSRRGRTWPQWGRIRGGNPKPYVTTVIVRLATSCWRRKWRGEVPTEVHNEQRAGVAGAGDTTAGMPSATDQVDDHLMLAAALRRLPPGQRRVVLLRYLEDLPVSQVATLLGLSEGTVKRQAARGLATLREVLADE